MMFPTDYSIGPAQLASEAESRGYDSLWFPEHTHIPVGRRTPWPGGGELPQEYSHTLDPFVALGVAAAVTERLKLGTGICLVAQHDPIVLAKEVATLDHISGGRFVFGIGVGWNEDEMEDHGVDPKRRRSVVREKVLAMKALWTQDEASFDGEFVKLRAELVVAEAGAEAAPADPHGRRRRTGDVPPRDRVLRRLDADLRPRRRSSQRIGELRAAIGGGRSRPGDDPSAGVRRTP